MPTTTVTRTGRTWYGRPTYSITIEDRTGKIAFHGYFRKEASALGAAVGALIGDRPVGPVAEIMAREIARLEPTPGKEWTVRL